MKIIAEKNFERPEELVDIVIQMGDRSLSFVYPLCMIDDETDTLELGIDEYRYFD